MSLSLTLIIKRLLLIFLIFAGLYFAKDFLMPLSIAGVLATLFLPFCNWLERKKMSKGIAVLFCLLGLLFVFLFLGVLLGYKISELFTDMVTVKQKSIVIGTQVQEYIFSHLNITADEQLKIIKGEQPSYSNLVTSLLSSLSYIITSLLLVFVYFVFFLYYRFHIKKFLLKITAVSERTNMEDVIEKAAAVSQQYLLGLSKMIFLLWIMYGIGFSIIGVQNAIFFAILCGMLEIVPFVGNITGTLLTVLFATVHGANATLVIEIIAVYAVVQLIQGWILEPLILGPQVKINSLFTIMALVLGELVWGIPGIILAIPLTAILKIVCDHIDTLKPYGFLIGEIETTKKREIGFIKMLKSKWVLLNK